MFKTIQKPKLLSKHVEAAIEEAIRTRQLQPGEKLPSEHELCEQFSVSRTAVREALRMLQARGMVTIEKGRGMFVRAVSADTVTNPLAFYLQFHRSRDAAFDLVHARQIMEPQIAASAALHHTAADADKLSKDLDQLGSAKGGFAELAQLDMRFHLHIAEASENPLIPLLLTPLHSLMHDVLPDVYASVNEAREAAVEWHAKILAAILDRDAEAARQNMQRHLEIAEDHARRLHAKGDGA